MKTDKGRKGSTELLRRGLQKQEKLRCNGTSLQQATAS